MLYRSLRVVVTDWGNRRGRIFFPTGFAPSVAVHPRGYTTLRVAAPDWRGGHVWGASRRSEIVDGLRLGVVAVPPGWAGARRALLPPL